MSADRGSAVVACAPRASASVARGFRYLLPFVGGLSVGPLFIGTPVHAQIYCFDQPIIGNPLGPGSGVPALSTLGLGVLALGLMVAGWRTTRHASPVLRGEHDG